jgi:hypothetical protein
MSKQKMLYLSDENFNRLKSINASELVNHLVSDYFKASEVKKPTINELEQIKSDKIELIKKEIQTIEKDKFNIVKQEEEERLRLAKVKEKKDNRDLGVQKFFLEFLGRNLTEPELAEYNEGFDAGKLSAGQFLKILEERHGKV